MQRNRRQLPGGQHHLPFGTNVGAPKDLVTVVVPDDSARQRENGGCSRTRRDRRQHRSSLGRHAVCHKWQQHYGDETQRHRYQPKSPRHAPITVIGGPWLQQSGSRVTCRSAPSRGQAPPHKRLANRASQNPHCSRTASPRRVTILHRSPAKSRNCASSRRTEKEYDIEPAARRFRSFRTCPVRSAHVRRDAGSGQGWLPHLVGAALRRACGGPDDPPRHCLLEVAG